MAHASLAVTCDACGQRFLPPEGGICAECGRMLCDWHLHGLGGMLRQFFRRPRTGTPDGPVCRECHGREGGAPSSPAGRNPGTPTG